MALSIKCYARANQGLFQRKVMYYLKDISMDTVLSEDTTGTITPAAHVKRMEFALKVIEGDINIFNCCLNVLTNGTLAGLVDTDMLIDDTVLRNNMRNSFSKLSGWDDQ